MPVIYDHQHKQELDNNVGKLDGRYEEYDHKPVVAELNRLIHKQRIQRQELPVSSDCSWVMPGVKAVGTAFVFSFAAFVTYGNLHSGEHTEDFNHMQEDADNSMTAPIFYIALAFDLGVRKMSAGRFGIFGAMRNAASALYNNQTQPQEDTRPRHGLHMV